MVERWLNAVMDLVKQGYTESEIAQKLDMSVERFRRQCYYAKKYFSEEDD